MKKLLYLFVVLAGAMFIQLTVSGQYYVPAEPLNKNAILEEFTGVKCPNCPAGHQVLAQILEANPGRAFGIAFHPFNSSYTLPYAGDPDFRRHYADSLYMMPYCGTSRYMPSAFVSRRLWAPPERLTQRTNWAGYTSVILSEASPLNVGMATAYDEATKELSVVVDLYYTATVTNPHNLMVTLAENNLVSQQSGATGPYTHKHTFREAFTAQWGDPVTSGGVQGTYYRQVFTFDNTDSNYVMANCELLAYVIDNTTTEVVTGIGCNVGDTTWISPAIGLTADTLLFETHQQCLDGLTSTLFNSTTGNIILTYVQQEATNPFVWMVDPWPFAGFPHTLNPGDSVDLTVHIDLPIRSNGEGFLYDSLVIEAETGTRYLIIAVDEQLITHAGPGSAATTTSLGNYPNPFSGSTRVQFNLEQASDLLLEVFDLNGLKVKTLATGNAPAGPSEILWDGRNDHGNLLAPGAYFLRLSTVNHTLVRRCILIR